MGSGAGIAAFSARQVNLGASDVPMTASEQSAARGGPVTQVPDALGGVGVAYNLNMSSGAGQKLVAMLDWLTHSGQADAAANGYVPLPAQIQ